MQELREDYPEGKPKLPENAIEVEKTVLRLRKYRADYHERWMATANTTKTGKLSMGRTNRGIDLKCVTGRPVDALILPVLTSAALIPGDPFYTGMCTHSLLICEHLMAILAYITVANVVDHTTMVIPGAHADKHIDKFNNTYSPANELDEKIWQSC